MPRENYVKDSSNCCPSYLIAGFMRTVNGDLVNAFELFVDYYTDKVMMNWDPT